jgi:hypothetical protein
MHNSIMVIAPYPSSQSGPFPDINRGLSRISLGPVAHVNRE